MAVIPIGLLFGEIMGLLSISNLEESGSEK
jgi:hypothetical protein